MATNFQSDNLILLVGENVMPNAVSACVALTDGGRVILLCTKETDSTAQRLQGWLNQRQIRSDRYVTEDKMPSTLYRTMFEILADIKHGTIGLNYTGGTKSMAVHTYGALMTWARECHVIPCCTYLDARDLNLYKDPADMRHDLISDHIYVGNKVNISLNDMLSLHGWHVKKSPQSEPQYPNLAKAIALTNSNRDGCQAWQDWIKDGLRKNCRRSDKDDWMSNSMLREVRLKLPDHHLLQPIVNEMQNIWGPSSSAVSLGELASHSSEFRDLHENSCEYLDGKWLEHWTLLCLQGLADDLQLHDCCQNVVPAEKEFDLDVVAIRGHQLFAFSCTSASDLSAGKRAIIKQKLFEVITRAHQLGGDETAVALISCAKNPDDIEAEVKGLLGTNQRVKVFGYAELADLQANLRIWIKSQIGEVT